MKTLAKICFYIFSFLYITSTIAYAMCEPETSASFTSSTEVVAKSDKDLSNVILKFCDGSTQKFDNLSGYCQAFSGTGENKGKKIVGIYIKSGCNGGESGGNGGQGEFHANPTEDVCDPTECEPDEYYDEESQTCKPVCEQGYDECGVCGGPGAGECGCNLDIVKDQCGQCGGDGTSCLVTVCVGGIDGDTKTMTNEEFHALKESGESVLLGECPVSVCVMRKLDSLHATTEIIAESSANELVEQGLAVKGQCDFTSICRFTDPDYPNGKIEKVATITLENWLSQVNTYTDLSKCDLCPTAEQCYLECKEQFPEDPGWVGPCTEACDKGCGNFCNPLKEDCIYEPLDPSACALVNGFLNQINIATVINLSATPLNVDVSYRDLHGNVIQTLNSPIDANLKKDFIINEMGLAKDTYGLVCIKTDAVKEGQWIGGVTLYKANERTVEQPTWASTGFDFALYYPFSNPSTGLHSAPLNTFSLGSSRVANWIRIADAEKDGHPLTGSLFIYENGVILKDVVAVNIPDGGRFDFSGHDPLDSDKVGTAVFVPYTNPAGETPKFHFSTARYFYDCHENPLLPFGCTDFLSAYTVPPRKPLKGSSYTGVSTVDTFTVVEVNNPVGKDVPVTLRVYSATGVLKHKETVTLYPYGTHHFLVNSYLNNEVGYAEVDGGSNYVTSMAVFYKDIYPVLGHGHSVPFTDAPSNVVQISEFNSFLGQTSTVELNNVTALEVTVKVDVIDYLGNNVFSKEYTLPSRNSVREALAIPSDTYGTINVHGDGVIFRNYVNKSADYVLPFIGK